MYGFSLGYQIICAVKKKQRTQDLKFSKSFFNFIIGYPLCE